MEQWQRPRQRNGNGNGDGIVSAREAETVSGRMSSSEQLFQRIAPDVKLGQRVKIFAFTNLYGCEIGDDVKIGAFVEIQKGRAGGQPLQDFQPQLSVRRGDARRRGLHRPRRDVYQRPLSLGPPMRMAVRRPRRTGRAFPPPSSAGPPSAPAPRSCAGWSLGSGRRWAPAAW